MDMGEGPSAREVICLWGRETSVCKMFRSVAEWDSLSSLNIHGRYEDNTWNICLCYARNKCQRLSLTGYGAHALTGLGLAFSLMYGLDCNASTDFFYFKENRRKK